jgi:hypothetical protein
MISGRGGAVGKRGLWTETAAVTGLVLVFLAQQIVYPRLPSLDVSVLGLQFDQHLAARILELIRSESVWRLIAEARLPLERDGYHGTLMAYLYLPFFKFWGTKWWMFKYWHLLLAVPTLVFTYFMTRRLLGRATALLGLALLVIHPNFIGGMRIGPTLLCHMTFFSTGALCFLVYWWFDRRPFFLAVGALLAGAGMATNLWFYWFLAGLALLGVLYAPNFARRAESESSPFVLFLVAAVCFLIGASPVLYRELALSSSVAEAVSGEFASARSLRECWRLLPETFFYVNRVLAADRWNRFLDFGADHPHAAVGNVLFPVALWAAVFYLLWCRFLRRAGPGLMIFPVMLLVMFLLSPFHPGELHAHIFFFYPFPLLVIASAWMEAFRRAAGRRSVSVFLVVALAGFVFLQARSLGGFFEMLKRPEGFWTKSHVITVMEMADWLKSHGPSEKTVICYGVNWHLDIARQDFRTTLVHYLSDRRFRSVYVSKKGIAEDVSFSLSRRPAPGETTLALVRGRGPQTADVSAWPSGLRDWYERTVAQDRRAAWSYPDGAGGFEIYPSIPLPGSPEAWPVNPQPQWDQPTRRW